jgi:hypothetical protein
MGQRVNGRKGEREKGKGKGKGKGRVERRSVGGPTRVSGRNRGMGKKEVKTGRGNRQVSEAEYEWASKACRCVWHVRSEVGVSSRRGGDEVRVEKVAVVAVVAVTRRRGLVG